jgi:hypothetical protein
LDVDVLLAANEALENTLLEIKKLIPASGLAQEETYQTLRLSLVILLPLVTLCQLLVHPLELQQKMYQRI